MERSQKLRELTQKVGGRRESTALHDGFSATVAAAAAGSPRSGVIIFDFAAWPLASSVGNVKMQNAAGLILLCHGA